MHHPAVPCSRARARPREACARIVSGAKQGPPPPQLAGGPERSAGDKLAVGAFLEGGWCKAIGRPASCGGTMVVAITAITADIAFAPDGEDFFGNRSGPGLGIWAGGALGKRDPGRLLGRIPAPQMVERS